MGIGDRETIPRPRCACVLAALEGRLELPPRRNNYGADWTCSACGGAREYHVKIVVANGGIVGRCAECTQLTLLRPVTYSTLTAGVLLETNRTQMCEPCIDRELPRWHAAHAPVIDARPPGSRLTPPAPTAWDVQEAPRA